MESRSLIFKTYHELEKFSTILDGSGNKTDEMTHSISVLKDQIISPDCKIAVVGEFKRGKTSFINAVLGEKILPEAVSPWTAVQTEIVFAETETAYVWTESDCKQSVDRASLEGWLTKSNVQAEKAQKARIGYPSSFLLDNEVTLVDTPGLNDHEDLDMRTFDMVRDADILIWMLSNSSPFSSTELNYVVDLVRNSKVSYVIFVMNKIDIVEDEDRDVLLQTVIQRINEMSEDVQERKAFFYGDTIPVFGFSAKYALKAREKNDPRLLWDSGLPALQEKLEEMIRTVCWNKKTLMVLHSLSQQIENEVSQCDEKMAQWNEMANTLDAYEEELSRLQNYFGSDIIDQAKTIGSNLKRQVKSNLMLLQSKFHQIIYSRGYGVLSACCDDANSWARNYRDSTVTSVALVLKELYEKKQMEFMSQFSEICRNAGIESVNDRLTGKAAPPVNAYFRQGSFSVIDFPKLLFMRNSSAREEYIDRVVCEGLERFASRWDSDCSTLTLAAVKEMNAAGNAMVQSQSAIMEEISGGCRKKSSQMAESGFYNGLKAELQEVLELKTYAEENLLCHIDKASCEELEQFANRWDSDCSTFTSVDNAMEQAKGAIMKETSSNRDNGLIAVLREIKERKTYAEEDFV